MSYRFGIYTFTIKKSINDFEACKDYMVGEIRLDKKSYMKMSLEEACTNRIMHEIKSKSGTEALSFEDIADLKCYSVDSDKESHADTEVRKYILKNLTKCKLCKWKGAKTEIIKNITREEIDNAMVGFTNNSRNAFRTINYNLRAYQEEKVAAALPILQKNKRVLMFISTRGGKSFMGLELARRNGAQNILIVTPFPSAKASFQEVAINHDHFKDWWMYDKDDFKEINEKNKNIVLLSFQIFDKDFDKQTINDLLEKVHFDTIIIDETHNTSASSRSEEILKQIGAEYEIHMSGTPFNDIFSERFSEDEIVSLDFIELIDLDKKSGHTAVGFPRLVIKDICNMEELNQMLVEQRPDLWEKDAEFSLKKTFSSPEKTYDFLRFAFHQPAEIKGVSNDMRFVLDGHHNHILMFVPTVQAACFAKEALDKLKNAEPLLKDYQVMPVSGVGKDSDDQSKVDSDFDFGDLEKSCNEFEAKYEKTIIISCCRLTTGVTLRRCDTILLMKPLESPETYVQILFRCMTPFKGKTKAELLNYDTTSSLKVINEAIMHINAGTSRTKKQGIDRFFNVVDYYSVSEDGFTFKSVSPEEYLKKVSELPTSFSFKKAFINLDIGLSVKMKKMLASIDFGSAKDSFAVTEAQFTKVKSKPQMAVPKGDEAEEIKEVEHGEVKYQEDFYEKKLQDLLRNIDWDFILSDALTIEDPEEAYKVLLAYIKNRFESTSYGENAPEDTGKILIEIVEKLFKKNKAMLKQYIEDYGLKFRESPDVLLGNLSNLSKEDQCTPVPLIEKMIESWKPIDPNKTYLDPCCGRGTILKHLHEKYGVPKSNLYGIDIDKRNVTLLKKIGYDNVILGDALTFDGVRCYPSKLCEKPEGEFAQ